MECDLRRRQRDDTEDGACGAGVDDTEDGACGAGVPRRFEVQEQPRASGTTNRGQLELPADLADILLKLKPGVSDLSGPAASGLTRSRVRACAARRSILQ
eukprot:COSAG06_NODE_4286_length_4399_cov_3.887907_2_plen_100_part_00